MSTPPVFPARRLEDRIQDLCARALHTAGPEWSVVMHELQLAMPEHGLRLANLERGRDRRGDARSRSRTAPELGP